MLRGKTADAGIEGHFVRLPMVLDDGLVEAVEQLLVGRETERVAGLASEMALPNHVEYDGYHIAKHLSTVEALRLREGSQHLHRIQQALVLFVGKTGNRTTAIAGCIAGVGIGVLQVVVKLSGYGNQGGTIVGRNLMGDSDLIGKQYGDVVGFERLVGHIMDVHNALVTKHYQHIRGSVGVSIDGESFHIVNHHHILFVDGAQQLNIRMLCV